VNTHNKESGVIFLFQVYHVAELFLKLPLAPGPGIKPDVQRQRCIAWKNHHYQPDKTSIDKKDLHIHLIND